MSVELSGRLGKAFRIRPGWFKDPVTATETTVKAKQHLALRRITYTPQMKRRIP